MSQNPQFSKEARSLLLHKHHGILSTISVEIPGYPFGSVVPYCLDFQGNPVILISTIAQHTKNIRANSKVSLTITEEEIGNVQAKGRLTIVANAIPIEKEIEEIGERYYQYYPESKDYHQTHDFSFYRLELVRARFIGGFGKIHWIQPDLFLNPSPFTPEEETRIINHMNEDHQKAMRHYLRAYRKMEIEETDSVKMAGIDSEGFDLRFNKQIVHFEFDESISNTKEARTVLVAMAKKE